MSYAATPTLSVAAPQLSVRLFSVISEQLGEVGAVGASVSEEVTVTSR